MCQVIQEIITKTYNENLEGSKYMNKLISKWLQE